MGAASSDEAGVRGGQPESATSTSRACTAASLSPTATTGMSPRTCPQTRPPTRPSQCSGSATRTRLSPRPPPEPPGANTVEHVGHTSTNMTRCTGQQAAQCSRHHTGHTPGRCRRHIGHAREPRTINHSRRPTAWTDRSRQPASSPSSTAPPSNRRTCMPSTSTAVSPDANPTRCAHPHPSHKPNNDTRVTTGLDRRRGRPNCSTSNPTGDPDEAELRTNHDPNDSSGAGSAIKGTRTTTATSDRRRGVEVCTLGAVAQQMSPRSGRQPRSRLASPELDGSDADPDSE